MEVSLAHVFTSHNSHRFTHSNSVKVFCVTKWYRLSLGINNYGKNFVTFYVWEIFWMKDYKLSPN